MGVGQELTNGLKGVGHVFSFMLKQKKSPPPPHINNDRSPSHQLVWYCPQFSLFLNPPGGLQEFLGGLLLDSPWPVPISDRILSSLIIQCEPEIHSKGDSKKKGHRMCLT